MQDYEQTIVFGNINANELNDLYERAVELGGEDSESAKRIEQLMNESIEYSDARNKDYPDLVEEINKRELNIKNLDPSKKINERKISPNELSSFVGCFLTGTAAEVTPVSKIAEHTYKVCNLILDLSASYEKLVRKKKAA